MNGVGLAGHTETMRAIWKGAVSFGLVSVPVKLYSATESHDVSFRQVHAKDGGRIKYQRVCSHRRRGGRVRRHRQGLRDRGRRDGHPHRRRHGRAAVDVVARDLGREVRAVASRSTRCCSRSPTTSSPRRPAPSPTPCSARRSLDADRMARRDRRAAPADLGRRAPRARRRDRAADDDVARRDPQARLLRRRPARSSRPR